MRGMSDFFFNNFYLPCMTRDYPLFYEPHWSELGQINCNVFPFISNVPPLVS